MTLALFLCIAWFEIWSFIAIQHKIHLFENIYIFLMIYIIEVNVNWIIMEELNKFMASKEVEKYLAYILYSIIIFPLSINIFINVFATRKSLWGRIFTVVFTILILTLMEILCINLGIYIYKEWSFLYTIIYKLGMFALALCLLGTCRKIFGTGVR